MLHRTATHDLTTSGDGRTVYGVLMPFDVESTVDDGFGPYTESFQRGAFSKTIRENRNGIKLLVNHDKYRSLPIGKSIVLREDPHGLYGEFRVSQTRAGDEAITLVRDGVVDAFSVGFNPIQPPSFGPGAVKRTEVRLFEASLVGFPAYAGALVAGVRSEFSEDELERAATWLREHPDVLSELNLDTPPVEPSPPADEAGSQPVEATGDVEPPEGHSRTDQPPPTGFTVERRRDDIAKVRNLLDEVRRRTR